MNVQSTANNNEKSPRGDLEEIYKMLSEGSQKHTPENIQNILSKIKSRLDKLSNEGISDEAVHKQVLGSVNEALNLIDKRIAELDRLKQEKAPLLYA